MSITIGPARMFAEAYFNLTIRDYFALKLAIRAPYECRLFENYKNGASSPGIYKLKMKVKCLKAPNFKQIFDVLRARCLHPAAKADNKIHILS